MGYKINGSINKYFYLLNITNNCNGKCIASALKIILAFFVSIQMKVLEKYVETQIIVSRILSSSLKE